MCLRYQPSTRQVLLRILLIFSGCLGGISGATASTQDSIWRLSETKGQCDATTPLDPGTPGQFVVGLSSHGTHLTLQDIRWQLPANSTNSMPVRFSFDHAPVIETDALVIAFAGAFQIFFPAPTMSEAQFWVGFLKAKTVQVSGPFVPGSVEFALRDARRAAALLQECAQRQLPGQRLPFEPVI